MIPAFNEARQIGNVISELKKAGYLNILVVDDGSSDMTAQEARQAGAEVLSHIINRGQGAAIRGGLEYLRENFSPEAIVTFDADGQHRAEDIKELVRPILENRCDIVLGSRFLNQKTSLPPLRRLVLKAGVVFTNFISGIKLTDTHNGLRAFGKNAYSKIRITQRKMEHASEIIDEIKKKNLRYCEIPVTIRYTDYSLAKGQRSSNCLRMGTKIILKKLIK